MLATPSIRSSYGKLGCSRPDPLLLTLANKGCDLRLIQDYLGHKQVQNTVRYTALNAKRFGGLW